MNAPTFLASVPAVGLTIKARVFSGQAGFALARTVVTTIDCNKADMPSGELPKTLQAEVLTILISDRAGGVRCANDASPIKALSPQATK